MNTYKSDPLCSIRAKIHSNRILQKHGLTISISEGPKTNSDSSRWTKFTVSRTAPKVASYTQQGNSETQISSHEQDNAFISSCSFPLVTPRAGWESWVSAVTKNRLRVWLRTCKHQTTLRGGQGKWMAVTVLRVTAMERAGDAPWQAALLSSLLTRCSKEGAESKQSPGRSMSGDPGSG